MGTWPRAPCTKSALYGSVHQSKQSPCFHQKFEGSTHHDAPGWSLGARPTKSLKHKNTVTHAAVSKSADDWCHFSSNRKPNLSSPSTLGMDVLWK